MATRINWSQLGQDFQQKYEGTFCRYISPLTKKQEVFFIQSVQIKNNSGPDLVLYNERAGELFLNYAGESTLDFTYPEVGMFQHKDKALYFTRRYQRQWKKGCSAATAAILFPYTIISDVHIPTFDGETLTSAFEPTVRTSLEEAKGKLNKNLSVTLTKHFSLGLGNKDELILWWDDVPVAEVRGQRIELSERDFEQEVRDYLRDTGDYAHTII